MRSARPAVRSGVVLLVGAVPIALLAGVARADDAKPPAPAGPPMQPVKNDAPPPQPDAPRPASDLSAEAERLARDADAKAPRGYVLPGEIVVSAADGGVPLTFAHGRDIADHETLSQFPQGSITEVLRQVPGVFIQSDAGNDVKMSIGIRGQQSRVSPFTAILVDGIPVKQTLYGVVDLDIFPFTFERAWKIDVIRGGADLRYGPNAYGGVVNFVTEPIPEKPMVRFAGAYGSDNEYSEKVDAGGTWHDLGVLVTGVQKGGDGWRENSEYAQGDASAKFSYRFDDANRLTATVNRFIEDLNFAAGITQAQFDDDPEQARSGTDYGRGDVTRYNFQYAHEFSPESAFELIGWYHRSYREFSLARPNLPPFTTQNHQPANYVHRGLEGRMSWTAKPFFGIKHSFFHSARYYRDETNRFSYTVPFGPGDDKPETVVSDADFETMSFAIYNEDTISLTDTVDVTVGLRNEAIGMDVDNLVTGDQASSNYTVSLPTYGASWRFVPNAALFASWSEGFGTPLYSTMDPSNPSYNPDLEPEQAKNKEIGARTQGQIPGLDASVTWFRQEYEDKIERVNDLSGVARFFNTGTSHAEGVELSASFDLGTLDEHLTGFSVWGNYTDQEAFTDHGSSAPSAGDDLAGLRAPNVPEKLSNFGITWKHRSGLWARVSRNHTGDYFSDLLNSDPPTADDVGGYVPKFTVYDASIGWRQNEDGTGFAVALGVTNLTDNNDWFRRNNAGIHPGAPRRFNVSASYTLNF